MTGVQTCALPIYFGGADTMYINCNRNKESVYKRDFLLTHVGAYIDVYEILNTNIISSLLSANGKALDDYKYFVNTPNPL